MPRLAHGIGAGCVIACAVLALAAGAWAQPVEVAAPYLYLGGIEQQPAAEIVADSGVSALTLSAVDSGLGKAGGCVPEWQSARPLLGGPDQAAIEEIRAAGAEVAVSFGGLRGSELGARCKNAKLLAAAYQSVINDYSLQAIDVDIENKALRYAPARLRTLEALAMIQHENPGLEISITFGANEFGPEPLQTLMIEEAAALGFQPNAWTIMPFYFGTPNGTMGQASIRATEGLAHDISSDYHVSEAFAYEHAGISSINGRYFHRAETVTYADFETMLGFAERVHLARFTFWSVNRDRPCSPLTWECSEVAQTPYQFSQLIARYHG